MLQPDPFLRLGLQFDYPSIAGDWERSQQSIPSFTDSERLIHGSRFVLRVSVYNMDCKHFLGSIESELTFVVASLLVRKYPLGLHSRFDRISFKMLIKIPFVEVIRCGHHHHGRSLGLAKRKYGARITIANTLLPFSAEISSKNESGVR